MVEVDGDCLREWGKGGVAANKTDVPIMSQKWIIRGSYIYSMVCIKVLEADNGDTKLNLNMNYLTQQWMFSKSKWPVFVERPCLLTSLHWFKCY